MKLGDILRVDGFSSSRFRIEFHAVSVGYYEDRILFTNLYNPYNVITVYSYSGILKDPASPKKNDLVLEFESGNAVQQGQQFHLENGYFGQILRKRLWIRNTSEDQISIVGVSAVNSGDVTFTIGKHLADEDIRQNALAALTDLSTRGEKSSNAHQRSHGKEDERPRRNDMQEDFEYLSSWIHPQGDVAYDPISLGLWDHANAEDVEFTEERLFLNFENEDRRSAALSNAVFDFRNQWKNFALNSSEELTIKPAGRIALTISYRPIVNSRTAKDSSDDGTLRPAVIIISILSRLLSRARSATDYSHHFWWRSYSAQSPTIDQNLFALKAHSCWSIISAQPSCINLGECSIGEYYTAEFTITNLSDLPALVFPFVNNETIGITKKEVHIPPRDQTKVQIDYVPKVISSDYYREVYLYNAYHPASSPRLEVKAKHIDSNQILSHSIFYKILTRNKRRQLQIYFDRAFYNCPSVRIFSIRNIFTEPLRLRLKSCDPYEISVYAYGSNTSITIPKIEGKSQYIEDLKWGESLTLSRRILNNSSSYTFNRRSNSSLDLNDEDSDLPVLNNPDSRRDTKSQIEDCMKFFENPSFPFDNGMLPDLGNAGNEGRSVHRIRLVSKCIRQLKESVLELIHVDGVECTLEVGKTYDFLVVYEPRAHGILKYRRNKLNLYSHREQGGVRAKADH